MFRLSHNKVLLVLTFFCGLVFQVPSRAGTVIVTNTADGGAGSLREALTFANANPGTTVNFGIPGAGTHTISPASALPDVSGTGTIIDGTSQPTYAGTPVIEITGASAGAKVHGFKITAGQCSVRGLVINAFTSSGIYISGSAATGISVQGCYIGTDVTGTTAKANGGGGLSLAGGAHDNVIGGLTDAARNIVSGNTFDGIVIAQGAKAITVQGNFIGTDVTGTVGIPNGRHGVTVTNGSSANTIGGTQAGVRNVISGNHSFGIYVGTFSNVVSADNTIQGNYVGTDVSGTKSVPNGGGGIQVAGATGTLIGGTVASTRNLISGNDDSGLLLSGIVGGGTKVQGNYIGTDFTGKVSLGNASNGILLGGGTTGNLIGGNVQGAGNIISGNLNSGITAFSLSGPPNSNNTIQGNFIGTDVTGKAALPNAFNGIQFSTGNTQNTVGGNTAGARNIISGNKLIAIWLSQPSTTANTIQGNYIGTDVTGTVPLPNEDTGIVVSGNLNIIGGTGSGEGNLIAFNTRSGVSVGSGSTGNSIRGNAIYDNGRIGINISTGESAPYITPNDSGDADTGANNLQNYPVITSAARSGANILITGTLNSNASRTFGLDFFRSQSAGNVGGGEGQAQFYLGSADITTAANGDITFSATVPATGSGTYFTATATDTTTNDTSELSRPLTAVIAPPGYAISGRCVSIRADSTFAATQRFGMTGATITLLNSSGGTVTQVQSNADGNWTFSSIAPGNYTMTASVPREGQADVVMDPPTHPVTVSNADVAAPRFALYSIFGIVKKPNGSGGNVPLAGATVQLINPKGVLIATRTTGADGKYEFRNQRAATFTVKATASGYSFPTKTVTLQSTGETWSPCARAHLVGVPAGAPSGQHF